MRARTEQQIYVFGEMGAVKGHCYGMLGFPSRKGHWKPLNPAVSWPSFTSKSKAKLRFLIKAHLS